MKSLNLLAMAVLMTATAAGAKDADDDRAARQEKKICKTEKMTGSLTRVRRICLTRSEWARLSEVTRANIPPLERDANQKEAMCAHNGNTGVGPLSIC